MCDKETYKYNGSITLILGPMFSGKTSSLINEYKRYVIGGKKCLMIKNNDDNRYDANFIKTHDFKYDYDNNYKKLENGVIISKFQDNTECYIYNCDLLYKADKIILEYDNIFIDEIQFFKDCVIYCDKWANQGKNLFCSGLSGTYERKPFDNISHLIPLAENIIFKSAVCKITGKNANFSKREIENKNIFVIGNNNMYSATDRETYFKNLTYKEYIEYEKNNLQNFLNIYNEVNNNDLIIDDNNFNNYIINNFGQRKIIDYDNIINNRIHLNNDTNNIITIIKHKNTLEINDKYNLIINNDKKNLNNVIFDKNISVNKNIDIDINKKDIDINKDKINNKVENKK